MPNLYFKSLSGDIITISFEEFNNLPTKKQKWEKILNIISTNMDCSESQIVIIEDIENKENATEGDELEKALNIPSIIEESQHFFLVREKDYYNHICVSVFHNFDNDNESYIEIYNTNNPYDSKKKIIISLNNDSNMYYILLEELNKLGSFVWYDRLLIADRIMKQFEKSYEDEYYSEYLNYTEEINE